MKRDITTATEAEKNIVKALSTGKTLYDIAAERGTKYSTVSTQLALMRHKFKCQNAAHLVGEFFRAAIIS